ncbi:hypothetical protein [Streptomyces murinus]|uniref:hypothetical protein n=1 Tax=Streptomyces murinus TaxID=33900 RepID=UPI003F45FC5C
MLITDAAVQETATTLVQSLGHNWALDPGAPSDGAAHLIHSDGRAISFRPVFGGAIVQLWITGNAAPSLPDDASPADRAAHKAHLFVRLAEGHRYNKAASLITEDDEDPADILLSVLENHLLPAFGYKPYYVGHRPWDELFADALDEVMDEATPGTSLRDCGPEAHIRPRGQDAGDEQGPAPAPVADADPADLPPLGAPTDHGDQDAAPQTPDEEPLGRSEATPAAEVPDDRVEEAPEEGEPPTSNDTTTGSTVVEQSAADSQPAAKRRSRRRTSAAKRQSKTNAP